MDTHTTLPVDQLPAVIRDYLQAHTARDADTAIRAFTTDAVVRDQDEVFRGTEEVLDFLRHAGAEFTYTTELRGAERTDDEHWVALVHIEGDFPGGVADLRYAFVLDGGLIGELTIGG